VFWKELTDDDDAAAICDFLMCACVRWQCEVLRVCRFELRFCERERQQKGGNIKIVGLETPVVPPMHQQRVDIAIPHGPYEFLRRKGCDGAGI
jgi:hypothetical protein